MPRLHWAAGSKAFDTLPEEEKRGLIEVDFSIDAPPFDLYSVMSLDADEAGAARPGEGKSVSSMADSLKHAPSMAGCLPSTARTSFTAEKQSNLIPGRKPE